MRTIVALSSLSLAAVVLGHAPANSATPQRGLELVTIVSDERLEDIKISADDRLMVTHDRGFAPRLWDLATMRIIAVLQGHPGWVRSIDMPEDADRLLTRSDDMVRIWNTRTGLPLGTWSNDSKDPITRSAISPDGTTIAVGTEAGRVLVAKIGDLKLRELGKHADMVSAMAFDASGKLLVTGGSDNKTVLWDLATGTQKTKFAGHKERVAWVEMSRDGRDILTTGFDGTARLWDAATGVQRFSWAHVVGEKGFHTNTLMAALLVDKDQSAVAVCGKDGTINLHSRKDGSVVRVLAGYKMPVREIRRTRDGMRLATHASYDMPEPSSGLADPLKLWDVATGKEFPFERFSITIGPTAGEFAADGSGFWIGYSDGSLRKHVLRDGSIQSVTLGATQTLAAAFQVSPQGAIFAAQPVSWLAPIGARYFVDPANPSLSRVHYSTSAFYSDTLSPLGGFNLAGGTNEKGQPMNAVWDHGLNKYAWGFWDGCTGTSWAKEGVAVAWDETEVHAFDVANRQYLGEIVPSSIVTKLKLGKLTNVSVSSDLQSVVIEPADGAPVVGEAGKPENWKPLTPVVKNLSPFGRPKLSEDGKWLVWADNDAVAVYSLPDGTQKWRFDMESVSPGFASANEVYGEAAAYIVPGGNRVVFTSAQAWVLLDAKTGKVIRWYKAEPFVNTAPVLEIPIARQFSPDGLYMIQATSRGGIITHLETGKIVSAALSVGETKSATFSFDGKRVLLMDSINQVSIYDPGTLTTAGEPKQAEFLGNFMAMRNGDWLVIDAEGRYDAADPSQVSGASYVLRWAGGLEPIDDAQLKSQFYEPNLLQKLLGLNAEPRRTVPGFEDLRLYPTIQLERSPTRPDSLRVMLTERDEGGIGTVRVFVNGKQVEERKGTGFFNLDLRNYRALMMPEAMLSDGKKNQLQVTATNARGDLTSRPTSLDLEVPRDLKTPEVNLYMLAVGVGDYVGNKRDLVAPPADAIKIAEAIQRAGSQLLPSRIHIQTLTTGTAQRPTRTAILDWFTRTGKVATSSDIVIVFFAGHGTNRIGDQSGYFFLTADADPSSVTPGILGQSTISDQDLLGSLKGIAASKQVIILDTCHSGAATDSLISSDRSLSGDYARAYEAIREAAGTYILAGSAADQLSYESTNVEHGMLTYSLLEAIDRASPDGLRSTPSGELFVDVERWLGYAAARVESLKNEVGIAGIQRPEFKRAPQAKSFDIGVINAADRGQLGLKPPRPIVILGTFDQDEEDPLDLEKLMAAEMRQSDLVKAWTDIAKHPSVYRLAGSYNVAGDKVTLKVFLQQFDREQSRKTLATFEVTGQKAKLADLVLLVRKEAEKRVLEFESKKL